jgi:hypothetical protein
MTKTQQLALIEEAFYALPEMQDGFKDAQEVIFDMCVASEKAHRKGHGPYNCSVGRAAMYFTVHYLLDGWQEPDHYMVDDILHIRNEVLYAQAYAKQFHKELEPWVLKCGAALQETDYCDIIK